MGFYKDKATSNYAPPRYHSSVMKALTEAMSDTQPPTEMKISTIISCDGFGCGKQYEFTGWGKDLVTDKPRLCPLCELKKGS